MKKNENMMSFIIFILLTVNGYSGSLNIKIVFPYFQPNSVKISGSFTSWGELELQALNPNTFQYKTDGIITGSNQEFYAFFTLPPFNNSNPFYIASNYRGLNRLLYAKIYINNQLISSNYVGSNSNINFTLTQEGAVFPLLTNGPQNIDDRIPPEVHWPYKVIRIPNAPSPNLNLINIVGWAVVLHDNNYNLQSKVEIDYLRLYARIGNIDTLISSDEYDTPSATFNHGGLYWRYPFFPGDDSHDPMPGTIFNGSLIFYPSSIPDTVWHFWNEKRAAINSNYTSYYVEIKYRITGNACIQIGMDFRNVTNTVYEVGLSDWKFESYNNEWEILRFDSKVDTVTFINKEEMDIPNDFTLFQNYPNPFNPYTNIDFSVPKISFVKIEILDFLGRVISVLVNENKLPGNYSIKFDATQYSSGVYFYRMKTENFESAKKLLLLK